MKEFDDATDEGDVYPALFDMYDAAGKLGKDMYDQSHVPFVILLARQAVLWTRHQQRTRPEKSFVVR